VAAERNVVVWGTGRAKAGAGASGPTHRNQTLQLAVDPWEI